MNINTKYKFNMKGWWQDSYRHMLASKGIKTKRFVVKRELVLQDYGTKGRWEKPYLETKTTKIDTDMPLVKLEEDVEPMKVEPKDIIHRDWVDVKQGFKTAGEFIDVKTEPAREKFVEGAEATGEFMKEKAWPGIKKGAAGVGKGAVKVGAFAKEKAWPATKKATKATGKFIEKKAWPTTKKAFSKATYEAGDVAGRSWSGMKKGWKAGQELSSP